MAKPISPKSLYARISAVIDRPRPFVRAEDYFGPDRRRRVIEFQGADRRSNEPEIVEGDKAYAGQSTEENKAVAASGADSPPGESAATAESEPPAGSNTVEETTNGG